MSEEKQPPTAPPSPPSRWTQWLRPLLLFVTPYDIFVSLYWCASGIAALVSALTLAPAGAGGAIVVYRLCLSLHTQERVRLG